MHTQAIGAVDDISRSIFPSPAQHVQEYGIADALFLEKGPGYFQQVHRAHQPSDYMDIVLHGTGHGIAKEILDKVFERYFTTRESDQGTGFGLWMINNLVHKHHGHITVQSTEGVGTEFGIYLPTADTEAAVNELLTVPVPQMSGRIVVVDDEVSVANFIGEVLRDKGYPTVLFTESPQALDYPPHSLTHKKAGFNSGFCDHESRFLNLALRSILAIFRCTGTGRAHKDLATVFKCHVASVSSLRPVFRLIAINDNNGPWQQRRAAQTTTQQSIWSATFDHPGFFLTGFIGMFQMNPRMWVHPLDLGDRST